MMPEYRNPILNAESVPHGASDDLEFGLILRRKRNKHHEEADKQPHQVGKGYEPAVSSAVTRFFASRHELPSNLPL